MAQDGLNPVTSSGLPSNASSPTSLQHWLGRSRLSVCYLTVFSALRSVSPASKTLGIGKVSVMVGVHKVKGNQGHHHQLSASGRPFLDVMHRKLFLHVPKAPSPTYHYFPPLHPQRADKPHGSLRLSLPPFLHPAKLVPLSVRLRDLVPGTLPCPGDPSLLFHLCSLLRSPYWTTPCSLSSETLSQAFWELSS